MAFDLSDLRCLYKFAIGRKFIMETGGGESTYWFSKIAIKCGAVVVSIDINYRDKISEVDMYTGWSVEYDDLIKPGHPDFCDRHPKYRKQKYPWDDERVIRYGEKTMKGERDLIRKIIAKYGFAPDLFFCDTGEFCGLAEWNVINKLIPPGGIFAAHDIYYPRSIKCFKVKKIIENSKQWRVLRITKTKQGLLISEKINGIP